MGHFLNQTRKPRPGGGGGVIISWFFIWAGTSDNKNYVLSIVAITPDYQPFALYCLFMAYYRTMLALNIGDNQRFPKMRPNAHKCDLRGDYGFGLSYPYFRGKRALSHGFRVNFILFKNGAVLAPYG